MSFIYWLPAIAYASLIFYLSHQSNPLGPGLPPDYLLHFVEYGLLSLAVLLGVTNGFKKEPTYRRVCLAIIVSTAYGALDEVHQLFVPQRFSSLQDLLADMIGASVFSLSLVFLLWLIRREG
jgi:VanZ family protein